MVLTRFRCFLRFRKAMLRSQQQHQGSLALDLSLPVIEELSRRLRTFRRHVASEN